MPVKFYNPIVLDKATIQVDQVNQAIGMATIKGVFLATAAVHFFYADQLVKAYTIGDGLAITGNNVEDESKTLTLTIQGADFSEYKGKILEARVCNLFTQNQVEVTFPMEIL